MLGARPQKSLGNAKTLDRQAASRGRRSFYVSTVRGGYGGAIRLAYGSGEAKEASPPIGFKSG